MRLKTDKQDPRLPLPGAVPFPLAQHLTLEVPRTRTWGVRSRSPLSTARPPALRAHSLPSLRFHPRQWEVGRDVTRRHGACPPAARGAYRSVTPQSATQMDGVLLTGGRVSEPGDVLGNLHKVGPELVSGLLGGRVTLETDTVVHALKQSVAPEDGYRKHFWYVVLYMRCSRC